MKLRKNKEKMFKDCPRCGIRCLATADTCQECGLVFARMEIATNADAKKKIKRGDKDYIIKTNNLPSDVSFAKLLTICACLGIFGGHCYYVGKYKQGILQTICVSIILLFGVFNGWIYENGLGEIMEIVSTILGFSMMLWPIDLVMILMKKFKVPVAIDIDGDVAHTKQKEDYFSSVKQAAKEVEIAKMMNEIEEQQGDKGKQSDNSLEDIGVKDKIEETNSNVVIEKAQSAEVAISETEKEIIINAEVISEQEKTPAVDNKQKQKVQQNRSQYKQTVKKYDSNGKKKKRK